MEGISYCDTHQTMFIERCAVCVEQDGTSHNGQYAAIIHLSIEEREAHWRLMAKENHQRILDKYQVKYIKGDEQNG